MHARIQAEPNLAYRPLSSLRGHAQKGYILTAIHDETVVGWIEQYPIWSRWWGLSSLYVEPEYRGRGIGREKLLPAAVQLRQNDRMYAATVSSMVWPALAELGFEKTTLASYPWQVVASLALKRYTSLHALAKLTQLSGRKFRYFYRKPHWEPQQPHAQQYNQSLNRKPHV